MNIKFLLLILTLLMWGCHSSDNDNIKKQTLIIKEGIPPLEAGIGTYYHIEYFQYEEHLLTSYINTQEYQSSVILSDTTNIYWNTNTVNIVDTKGNQYTYNLNDDGEATECTYTSSSTEQVRHFTFNYKNNQLTEIAQTIDGEIADGVYISYENRDISKMEITGNSNFSADFTVDSDSVSYCIPCIYILDSYPFSMHRLAWFAGILGKQPTHKIGKFATTYSEVTYSYKTEENVLYITETTSEDDYSYYRYFAIKYE